MKEKCPYFCATYCVKDCCCEVYAKDLIYAYEIDEACLRCEYNKDCSECLNYESCEDRGRYE